MIPVTIQIDVAEQSPFDFGTLAERDDTCEVTIEHCKLLTGDYAVKVGSSNPLDHIAVERKSLADLYATIGSRRNDFESEFQRLAVLGYGAVVIEADLRAIFYPNTWLKHPTSMNPRSVLGTLVAWSLRYHVPIWTCSDRDYATVLTYRLLTRWARDYYERSFPKALKNGSPAGKRTVTGGNPPSM